MIKVLELLKRDNFHFVVNDLQIVTVFDVLHLLKNTTNALLYKYINFDRAKYAKLQHIHDAYKLDKSNRIFKELWKLNNSYFSYKDSYLQQVKKCCSQSMHKSEAFIQLKLFKSLIVY